MIYKNQGIIAGKEMQRYQNQRERESPAPCIMDGLNGHLHNKNNRPISGRANPGSSNATMVSVCVKGKKARAEEQCA